MIIMMYLFATTLIRYLLYIIIILQIFDAPNEIT